MVNALTIDVEDYYNVFARDRLAWDGPPTDAVVRNTSRLLEILDGRGVKATFFVLGEVAETFAGLVADIAAAGHEVGLHGLRHHQVFRRSPEQFRQDLTEARKRIEDAAGAGVRGHRAPAFSIREETRWALEILAEEGLEYDSSVVPFSGKRYGWQGFAPGIQRMELPGGLSIVEAPIATIRLCGVSLPACGGGYLRRFPKWFTLWAMRRIQRVRPAVVYVHPYELDLAPPPAEFQQHLAVAVPAIRRFHAVQLRGRRTVEAKLEAMLDGFRFAPLADVIRSAPPE